MFTINQTNGIGEVIAQDEKTVTVYFSDTDKESKMLIQFVKIYNTYEEAEMALNPEMTNEEAELRASDAREEERIMKAGRIAQANIEIANRESSINLMKNI